MTVLTSRPTFAPACFTPVQCTLINFIATEKGLEDQLLAKVVGVERPELEKQAQELQSAFNQARAPRVIDAPYFFFSSTFTCSNPCKKSERNVSTGGTANTRGPSILPGDALVRWKDPPRPTQISPPPFPMRKPAFFCFPSTKSSWFS